MSEFNTALLIVTLFRLAMVFVGFGFVYLGYKLFCQGIFERAGELQAAWGDRNLALKQAAPGTFFALFGIVAIAISVWKGTGLEYRSLPNVSPTQADSSQQEYESEYKKGADFLESVGIPVDEISPVRRAFAYNVYYRCQQFRLSPDETEDVFIQLIVPAFEAAKAGGHDNALIDVRSELFKDMVAPPPERESPTSPSESGGEFLIKDPNTLG